ncbi:DUF1918 domain-containing protein [Georgenia muralis]|uniref:Uncharacterized protein DUF1876 n=1 Tax=Georgenia muralis TaxID=154117 RepID=A0A3N4ZB29_9MICO|nr:uncharacterized protein DUF1876 [Georgenia muralis]
MRAQRGDHIVLAAEHVGEPVRDGEIVEVRGGDGEPPYLVRWSDGHEGLIFPGPSAELRTTHTEAESAAAEVGELRPVHEWQVRVSVFEQGDDTTATVALISDALPGISASGESRRSPADPRVSRIGDEVAVARALRHLADQLMDRASHEVEDVTGEEDVVIRPR